LVFGHGWHDHRAVLTASVVGIAALLGASLLRLAWLHRTAAGLGLLAGTLVMSGGIWIGPGGVRALPLVAGVALALVLALREGKGQRAAWAASATLALSGAWLLSGTPYTRVELWAELPRLAVIAALTGALSALLLRPADPWRVPAAAFSLWATLHLLMPDSIWPILALVILGASFGQGKTGGGIKALPLAAGLGAAAGLPMLAAGRLVHGGFGRVDLAALAPALTLLLAWRWERRIDAMGGFLAALLAALASVLLLRAGGTLLSLS
jgi:hypothetical protein